MSEDEASVKTDDIAESTSSEDDYQLNIDNDDGFADGVLRTVGNFISSGALAEAQQLFGENFVFDPLENPHEQGYDEELLIKQTTPSSPQSTSEFLHRFTSTPKISDFGKISVEERIRPGTSDHEDMTITKLTAQLELLQETVDQLEDYIEQDRDYKLTKLKNAVDSVLQRKEKVFIVDAFYLKMTNKFSEIAKFSRIGKSAEDLLDDDLEELGKRSFMKGKTAKELFMEGMLEYYRDSESAMTFFLSIIDRSSDEFVEGAIVGLSHYHIALALIEQDDDKEVILNHLEKAATLLPNMAMPSYTIATYHFYQTKQFDQALRHFGAVINRLMSRWEQFRALELSPHDKMLIYLQNSLVHRAAIFQASDLHTLSVEDTSLLQKYKKGFLREEVDLLAASLGKLSAQAKQTVLKVVGETKQTS